MDTQVTREPWGFTTNGLPAHLWTLASANLIVRLTDFGAALVSVHAPDRNDLAANVLLGYSSVHGYESDRAYLGATIGRYSNRIANGRFTIEGTEYKVPANSGGNSLHSGPLGFNTQLWHAIEIPGGVELTHTSPDGHQGFPGEVTATVRFTLAANALRIDYTAVANRPTPVAPTNHAYFNLTGDPAIPILGHTLLLEADHFTPVDDSMIPTGEIAPVDGTPLDFRIPRLIGDQIDDPRAETQIARGYDHNFVLRPHRADELFLAAKAIDPHSGRALVVHTTEPGIQFYSGNHLAEAGFVTRSGFCLETQHFPDSPNHPEFPSTLLQPGQTLRSSTSYTFGVER